MEVSNDPHSQKDLQSSTGASSFKYGHRVANSIEYPFTEKLPDRGVGLLIITH